MTGPTFTIPGPILDMLAEGLEDDRGSIAYVIDRLGHGAHRSAIKVWMMTDAGDELTFLRAPEMERT